MLAATGAALFLAASPAANAASENGNSRTDPLIAWDGVRQALAYGTAYTKEGSPDACSKNPYITFAL